MWSVTPASDCAQRKADLEKAKSKGRPAVPPQAVHAVHEVGYSSASTGDEAHSASGSAGISVIRTAPGEVAYIWVLSAASMRNKHYPNGIMLDSGAAMSVCPVDYFPERGIQPSRRIELQPADGSPVEHYGSKDVFYMVGNEAMKVRFEVTSVKAPILSLAALEDAGCRLGHQNDRLVLRRGDLSLQVDRVDNVYWLFGLKGLGKANPDLLADLEEIELERQQVRRPELLPEEHHIHPRSKPLPKEPFTEERQAHELTHLPARSWCETYVKSFGLVIFRLLLSIAVSIAPIFCGSAVVLSVWDISVAFFHAMMDELVYAHPPRDMVPPGWCWKLRKSMYGTSRASRLWADYVRRVMEDETIAVFSMVFVNRSKRYIVAVWDDDFAFTVASDFRTSPNCWSETLSTNSSRASVLVCR